jgi:predicted aspartyl protease
LAAPFKEFLIMPDHMAPAGIDGTLAPDILRAYDDDFDFANATFSLVSKDHCPGKVVYWTDTGYSEVPFYRDRVGHIQTEVEMDGARFRVIFDTGFSRSIMGLDEARNLFHIPADSPLLKPADAPGFPGAFRYPFRRMTFGGVTLQNPDIILIPERDSRIEGAIIGISVLRQMHIYVAQDEGNMYVTPATAH